MTIKELSAEVWYCVLEWFKMMTNPVSGVVLMTSGIVDNMKPWNLAGDVSFTWPLEPLRMAAKLGI